MANDESDGNMMSGALRRSAPHELIAAMKLAGQSTADANAVSDGHYLRLGLVAKQAALVCVLAKAHVSREPFALAV